MQRYLLILSFVLLIFLPIRLYSQATVIGRPLQKVSLQLRWKHQFQFAGYYAAVHKGFYREAGLDVTINEGGIKPNAIEEVLENRSEYGVTNSEILLHRLQGKPLVVMAAVFQHSPLVLVSRKELGIRSPQDLVGKQIKMSRNSRDIELHAMFMNEGIDLDSMRIQEGFAKEEHYFDESISSIAAYLTNQPFYFEQKQIPYTVIFPRTYGIDFYGDCLFTSENELKHNPARAKAFREASIKGWAYAMTNVEEIIDVIVRDYKSLKSRDHLRYEAEKMRELILPDLVDIGHINPGRWKHIAKTFEQFGLIKPGYSL